MPLITINITIYWVVNSTEIIDLQRLMTIRYNDYTLGSMIITHHELLSTIIITIHM